MSEAIWVTCTKENTIAGDIVHVKAKRRVRRKVRFIYANRNECIVSAPRGGESTGMHLSNYVININK